MSVYSQIERVAGEIDTQKDLISQITTVLEGKAAGGGIIPTGTKTITENGTYDITSFASAVVNVAATGGGLPAGLSKVASGLLTPTSDVSSAQFITHGLGVKPDFWAVFADTGDTVVDADFNGYFLKSSHAAIKNTYNSNSYDYLSEMSYMTSATVMRVTQVYISEGMVTDTAFMISATSTYKLKSGITYRWIACVFE